MADVIPPPAAPRWTGDADQRGTSTDSHAAHGAGSGAAADLRRGAAAPRPTPTTSTRRWYAIGAVAVVALAIVWFASTSDTADTGPSTNAAERTPADLTPDPAAPPASVDPEPERSDDGAPEDAAPDAELATPTTRGPVATTDPDDPLRPADEATDEQSGEAPVGDAEEPTTGEIVEGTVDVPGSLASLAPTELVMLVSNVGVVSVELPSGRTTTTELSSAFTGTVTTSDAATLVWAGREHYVLDRAGSPTRVDLEGRAWGFVDHADGSFLVQTDRTIDARPQLRRVAVDGAVTDAQSLLPPGAWPGGSHPRGGLLVDDAGGTYQVGAGEPRRVTTGRVFTSGEHHILVRECDEALTCGTWSIDVDDGTRITAHPTITELFERFGVAISPAGLSPDGGALVAIDQIPPTTTTPAPFIVDLVTGERIPLPAAPFSNTAAWSADGAHLFVVVGRSVEVIDRSTGASIALDWDLGRIESIASRPPLPPG